MLEFGSKDNILIQAIEDSTTETDVKIGNTPVNKPSSPTKSFQNVLRLNNAIIEIIL